MHTYFKYVAIIGGIGCIDYYCERTFKTLIFANANTMYNIDLAKINADVRYVSLNFRNQYICFDPKYSFIYSSDRISEPKNYERT